MTDHKIELMLLAIVAIMAVVGLVLVGTGRLQATGQAVTDPSSIDLTGYTIEEVLVDENGNELSGQVTGDLSDHFLTDEDSDNQLTGDASLGKKLKNVVKKATKVTKKLKLKVGRPPGAKKGKSKTQKQTEATTAAAKLEATKRADCEKTGGQWLKGNINNYCGEKSEAGVPAPEPEPYYPEEPISGYEEEIVEEQQ